MRIFKNPERAKWDEILKRPIFDYQQLEASVNNILNDVKQDGDAALKKYTAQFDGVNLDQFAVTEHEIATAIELVDVNLKAAIELARQNITAFHKTQMDAVSKTETAKGVYCWRKSLAIEKVGLYIPGGTAPLFSTLLMLGIPALLAGCKEIVVCTPPGKDGKINPVILYVSQLLGLRKIYKIGGVQAVAAMAFGTSTIPKVDKIFGPGNQYVTCAKQMINAMGVAIDMPAGPSELAVYADQTCNPAFVASDLLSQAEHGADSQVVLVTPAISIVEKVYAEIEKQLPGLSRKAVIGQSLQKSLAIIMKDTDTAFDLLNEYAPEHLIIATDNADELADKVVNAGSVFLGHYSPESAGDYASGTNHTLPTNGFAKAYSGVSIDSFVKKITFQQIDRSGLQNIGRAVETMAAAEGLDAHKNAVTVRLEEIKKTI